MDVNEAMELYRKHGAPRGMEGACTAMAVMAIRSLHNKGTVDFVQATRCAHRKNHEDSRHMSHHPHDRHISDIW